MLRFFAFIATGLSRASGKGQGPHVVSEAQTKTTRWEDPFRPAEAPSPEGAPILGYNRKNS